MSEEIPLSSLDQRLLKQVESAEAAIKKGNPTYAIDVCSRILERHPECLDVRKILRRAQKSSNATKSAFLAKAIGGVTNAPFFFKNANMAKKEPRKALETADKMLKGNPNFTTGLKLLGQASSELGLHKTAVFAYEEIRELEPNNVDNLLVLGHAYVAAGEPKKAVQLGDEILTKKPNFAEAETLIKDASVALTVKAGWESENKDDEAAQQGAKETAKREQETRIMRTEEVMLRMIEEARAKLETESENLNHHRTIIDNLRKLERYEEALEAVRGARKTGSGSQDVTLERLEGELQLDILRHQISQKESELEKSPENTSLASEIDKLKAELLDIRLGRARDLVERYPNDFTLRFNYGEILLEKNDYDQAIAQFQLAQRNPKVRLRAIQNTAVAFKAKKQLEFAIEQFQKVKEEIPTLNDQKKDVIYELGICYEELGQMEKAISEYRTIYSSDIGYRDVAQKINEFYSKR